MLAGYLDVMLAHERVLRFVANDPAVQADADVGARLRRAYGRLSGSLAASTSGPDADVRAACALGAASAGVIHGGGLDDNRHLVLAAAQAALRSSVAAR